MASSCTSSLSSFILGASCVDPQNFTSSKPLFRTFSMAKPNRVIRDTSNWVSVSLQRELAMSRSYHHPLVAACSPGDDVAEPFGRADFSEEELLENLIAAIQSIEANKPPGAKALYWRSVHISSKRGPLLRLSIRDMMKYTFPVSEEEG